MLPRTVEEEMSERSAIEYAWDANAVWKDHFPRGVRVLEGTLPSNQVWLFRCAANAPPSPRFLLTRYFQDQRRTSLRLTVIGKENVYAG